MNEISQSDNEYPPNHTPCRPRTDTSNNNTDKDAPTSIYMDSSDRVQGSLEAGAYANNSKFNNAPFSARHRLTINQRATTKYKRGHVGKIKVVTQVPLELTECSSLAVELYLLIRREEIVWQSLKRLMPPTDPRRQHIGPKLHRDKIREGLRIPEGERALRQELLDAGLIDCDHSATRGAKSYCYRTTNLPNNAMIELNYPGVSMNKAQRNADRKILHDAAHGWQIDIEDERLWEAINQSYQQDGHLAGNHACVALELYQLHGTAKAYFRPSHYCDLSGWRCHSAFTNMPSIIEPFICRKTRGRYAKTIRTTSSIDVKCSQPTMLVAVINALLNEDGTLNTPSGDPRDAVVSLIDERDQAQALHPKLHTVARATSCGTFYNSIIEQVPELAHTIANGKVTKEGKQAVIHELYSKSKHIRNAPGSDAQPIAVRKKVRAALYELYPVIQEVQELFWSLPVDGLPSQHDELKQGSLLSVTMQAVEATAIIDSGIVPMLSTMQDPIKLLPKHDSVLVLEEDEAVAITMFKRAFEWLGVPGALSVVRHDEGSSRTIKLEI